MFTEKTLYLKYADGHLGVITSTVPEGQNVQVPEGAEAIEEAVYAVLKAEQDRANEETRAEWEAAHSIRQKADYDALVTVGIPDAVARRLSGWQGDA